MEPRSSGRAALKCKAISPALHPRAQLEGLPHVLPFDVILHDYWTTLLKYTQSKSNSVILRWLCEVVIYNEGPSSHHWSRDKHYDQSQLGEKRTCFILHLTVHHLGKLRQEAWAEAPEESRRSSQTADYQLSLFLRQPRPTCLGLALPTWAWFSPHQLATKKMPPNKPGTQVHTFNSSTLQIEASGFLRIWSQLVPIMSYRADRAT